MDVNSISEQLLFTTVRIETQTKNGNGVGTGFIFSYKHKEKEYSLLVTNKHVIKNAEKGTITFINKVDDKPQLGKAQASTITVFEKIWFGHPNADIDVCIAPLAPILNNLPNKGNVFFRSIPDSLIPTKEKINEIDSLEEVVFIGYPMGIWDKKNFLPIIRKGITATPISVDYDGQRQFLIDASVFPGSSGSPVFLYNAGSYPSKKGGLVVGSRLMFLGIVSSVYYDEQENELRIRNLKTADIPVSVSKETLDLGVVYKADTISETAKFFLEQKEKDGLLS